MPVNAEEYLETPENHQGTGQNAGEWQGTPGTCRERPVEILLHLLYYTYCWVQGANNSVISTVAPKCRTQRRMRKKTSKCFRVSRFVVMTSCFSLCFATSEMTKVLAPRPHIIPGPDLFLSERMSHYTAIRLKTVYQTVRKLVDTPQIILIYNHQTESTYSK